MTKPTETLITAEDLYRFQIITDMQISPDGINVVYAVQIVEKETEKKYTHLWLTNTETNNTRQITFGKHSNIKPRWSIEGDRITFLSNRDDKEQFQLYQLPMDGGEAQCLTSLNGEIGSYEWAPDGSKIVFQFRKTDTEVQERRDDKNKSELGIVCRHIDRVFYQLDDYGYLPKERWHIWVLELANGKTTQLTDHAVFDEMEPHWSPDSKSIAYFSNHTSDPDMEPDVIDIFIYHLASRKEEKIPTQPGEKQMLSFSPDGEKIAYLGYDGLDADWKNNNLWIVDIKNPHDWKNITQDFDMEIGGTTIADIGAAMTKPPVWSSDMSKLYFQIAQHGNTALFSIDLDGQNLNPILNETGVVSIFNFDQQQKKLAYVFCTLTDPSQIHLLNMSDNKSAKQITTLNTWLKNTNLGEIEEVWFKGADENDLQGWILKPPHFDPEKSYPSILEIHGGPMVQYGNYFMHEFYYLAANGYVVYFCNPRGGKGYGEAHTKAIIGQWGTADYADLMAWVDIVEKHPYIDKSRMGVTGGSYGGYMTNWIIGHTQRFQAAVTQRSVSNLISMWGSSDFNWVFQRIFGNKAPFESIENLWECSPIKHIGNAVTPTLVIHSENDLRCPLEQDQQVFTALKYLNIDTELVLFPEEPHGLSRTGRTDRRIARLNHILRWFNKYLKA
jgi:dipeptidyl aminopeptidase/acylaminoacyl peptidase